MSPQAVERLRVFISWSGEVGKTLAEGFRRLVLPDNVEGWVSSVDIKAGNAWFGEVEKALAGSAYGIGILTPGTSAAPWINFEAGFVYGRLKNFRILRFEKNVSGPLGNLHSVDATTEEGIAKLLVDILPAPSVASAWAKHIFPAWKNLLESEIGSGANSSFPAILQHHVGRLTDRILSHVNNSMFASNRLLRQTIIESMESLRQHIENATEYTYSLPASDYPEYLARLQQVFRTIRVSAIALVDQRERFWQQEQGRKILKSTHEDSTRIFVFLTPEDLTRSFDTILEHARKYNVAVCSHQQLAREFPDSTRDFAVLSHDSEKLLAVYEETGRVISFVADATEIRWHEEEFSRIKDRSIPVRCDDLLRLEDLIPQVFEELTAYPKRSVEMSSYIPEVDDYDKYEEEHAYFVEMMEVMIGIIEKSRGTQSRPIDILEFGAGTGIFTKRLAALPNVNVTAIELDWAYYTRLKHNLRHTQTHCYNEDSRLFNPPGRFDFVVSSFSDHHISLADKKKYFSNVKRNLATETSLFMVGDEFLPDHDENSKEDRKYALAKYHGHIIGIAESKKQDVLVRLERSAWDSGLATIEQEGRKAAPVEGGDYKVSDRQYERRLQENGLEKRQKILIGPQEHHDALGGVYVYVIGPKTNFGG